MAAVLETRSLCKSFGALTVADKINFRLEPGARHALIGPNGAGKTTFVNMLTGALAPTSGKIFLNDQEITRTSQSARVRAGLGRTFQVTTLFRNLPVLDNVALGVAERRGVAMRMWAAASSHKEVIEESRSLLAALGIADDAATRVADLPYGKQRLVEIAILIIEHDMDLVFRFAQRITVLVQGTVLVEAPPEEIARDKRVHQVYLGEQHA